MTKEYLLYKLHNTAPADIEADFISEIIEFFDSHVCIPKGENIEFNYCGGGWYIYKASDYEYRTKPEPVYEWDYAVITTNTMATIETMTLEEAEAKYGSNGYYKLVGTKRIRQ